MSTGTTVIIIIAIIVVVAVVAGIVYDTRRRRLRRQFGPEYDRLVDERDSRMKAEAELAGRQRRVRNLDIRPLDAAAQARYTRDWAAVQEQFVDAPQEAVTAAQRLVMTVMSERGYPTEGGDQMLADLSVEHARVLDHYRAAYEIGQRAADGMTSTEDLRQAMIHYRALFQDLLGTAPAAEAGPAYSEPVVAGEPGAGASTVTASEPMTNGEVATDREPLTDREPGADSEPLTDREVVTDGEPGVDGEAVPGGTATTPDLPRQRRS